MPRLLAFVVLASAALAQDERRVTSPNGQIEFRLFIAVQESNNLPRLAYEVFYQGKPLLKTSFMGLDIEAQEPLLGENVGLTSFSSTKSPKYNSLIAHYMQNGSLGRLIDVEARAYDDGVAFRYVIPPSTPLMEMIILEEATEFRFAENIPLPTGSLIPLSKAWVAIAESKTGNYPPMHFINSDRTTELTRLDRPFQATAPLNCPWRIILIGQGAGQASRSGIIADLNR